MRVVGVDDPEIEVFAETDAEGTVRVDRLPPGRYRVLAADAREDPGRPDVAARIVEVDLSPGATAGAGFTIPDVALVRGRVTIGGEAVADGRVGFGPLSGTPDWHRPLLFRVRAGAYEGLVPPGRYHVSVEVPGRRVEIEEVVDIPAAADFRLDWTLPAD